MSKRSFIVTLDVPEGVTLGTIEEFLLGAVMSEVGIYPPESLISLINRDSIKVRRIPKAKS